MKAPKSELESGLLGAEIELQTEIICFLALIFNFGVSTVQ